MIGATYDVFFCGSCSREANSQEQLKIHYYRGARCNGEVLSRRYKIVDEKLNREVKK